MVLSEYEACIQDFKEGNIDQDLMVNFSKVSKLILVLTVFDVSPQENSNYTKLSKKAQIYTLKVKKKLSEGQIEKPRPEPVPQDNYQQPMQPMHEDEDSMTRINNNTNNNEPTNKSYFMPGNQLRIQEMRFDKDFTLSLTEQVINKENFAQEFDVMELFNKVNIEVENHHSSFIKTRFKNNLHKVKSFQFMKKQINQAKNAAENKNLKKTYQMALIAYNDICKFLN